MKNLEPAEVFHPGEFLKDELEERNLTAIQFSQRTGIPIDTLNLILECKIALRGWMAERIGVHLGTGAIFWMNLNLAFYKKYPRSKTGTRPADNGNGA